MSALERIGWSDRDRADEALLRVAADMAKEPLIAETDIDRARSRSAELSDAELMLLRAMSRGLTLGEAADALGKSIETLKTQSKTARYKLRAKNTTHACCEAVRRGLIP